MKRVNLRSAREGHRQKENSPQNPIAQPQVYVGQDVAYPREGERGTQAPRPQLDPWYASVSEGVNALAAFLHEHPIPQDTRENASRMLTFWQGTFELSDIEDLHTIMVTFLFAPYNDRAMPVQRMLGYQVDGEPYVFYGLEEARIAGYWLLSDGNHFNGRVNRNHFFEQLKITDNGSSNMGGIGIMEAWTRTTGSDSPLLMRITHNPRHEDGYLPELYRTYLVPKPYEHTLFFIPKAVTQVAKSVVWHALNSLLVMWNPAWAVRRLKARRARNDQRRAQEVRFEKTDRADIYRDNTFAQYLSIVKWPG